MKTNKHLGKVERDRIELTGTVIDENKGVFKVQVNEDLVVSCTLSGKIRQNQVRILLSDKVRIEVSEYQTDKGRIVFREKK